MHFGKSNSMQGNHFGIGVYCMTDDSGNKREIEKTNVERNLGVNAANDLK